MPCVSLFVALMIIEPHGDCVQCVERKCSFEGSQTLQQLIPKPASVALL